MRDNENSIEEAPQAAENLVNKEVKQQQIHLSQFSVADGGRCGGESVGDSSEHGWSGVNSQEVHNRETQQK